MAETQSHHRQDLEKRVIRTDVRNATLGLVCAFLLSMSFLTVCYVAMKDGRTVFAGFLGTIDIVALVSVFIFGSRSRMKERREHRD